MNSYLAQKLLREDASDFFAGCSSEMYAFWVPLVQKTTLAPGTTQGDARVADGFARLDSILGSAESTPLMIRLAYVQWARMLDRLLEIIERDRRSCLVQRTSGRGDASILIDVYLAIKGGVSGVWREHFWRVTRVARRWAALGGPFPLLLITYSEEAEKIMATIPNHQLKALAEHMVQTAPPKLLFATVVLGEMGELSVRREDGCPLGQILPLLNSVLIS
ncbi:hypothetical protein GE09DRAFT_1249711 [Coniochaeta sp. 2T2.1]|nr:hypothetical protein GE09DRAFT_1249711 [Coniochaeta sp. 2T2.1]